MSEWKRNNKQRVIRMYFWLLSQSQDNADDDAGDEDDVFISRVSASSSSE